MIDGTPNGNAAIDGFVSVLTATKKQLLNALCEYYREPL